MLLALGVQMVFAQQKTVSGTLSDENGLPLPGATVIISGTSSGTSTDFDGKYQLAANVGDVLEISYVGYTTQSVNVGASNFYNIVMQSDNTLDEVVIVGYGTTTKKSFAGTATNIKAENIESKNFSNITQAISGEVAGVSVINTSGQPGTIGTVRIRGYGSPLGNRNPLYVVDGVAFGYNFDLNSLNPADIKTTTILKDATATAIYGSRGANGVVLITTKNGSQNKDAVIGVEFKTGVNQQLIPRYDVISSPEQYIGLVWEGLFNRGVTTNEADPIEFANDRLLGANGIGDGYNMWNVDSAATYINKANSSLISSNAENALFTFESSQDRSHPLYQNVAVNNRDDYCVSEYLVSKLTAMNDPRLEKFAKNASVGTIVGMPYGLSDNDATVLKPTTSRPNDAVREATSAHAALTYAEVQFLLAEAYQRGILSGIAEDAYKNGITASLNQWGITDGTVVDNYIGANAYNAANWKESIGTQKWVAFYMNGYQAWCEWRRLDYPQLAVPAAAELSSIHVKMPYLLSETQNNSRNLGLVTSTPANITTKVWWDVN